MTEIPTITLSDDQKMPQLGIGIFQVPPAETGKILVSAIEKGYRLIDGAFIYGNEAGFGEGIRDGGVPREDLFITTKVWNADQGHASTHASVARSLDTIGVTYLDLVLIHWPCPGKNLFVETWEALIEKREEGLIRSIGVSNFNPDHLDRIIDATGVTPVVNQVEVNPLMQNKKVVAANAAREIVTQSWTPLGQGKSFDAPEITAPAARTGKTPAQIILRWHLQLGYSVIPRSTQAARQEENLDIFDFTLTDDEMAAIAAYDQNKRTGPDPADFEVE
jgi:2,5-diketo-D-gluconate reductase A